MMHSFKRLAAAAAVVCLTAVSSVALAGDRPYKEGNVVQVAGIRTAYGMFDEYLKFLSTTWKAQMEASKKAGDIVSYEVLQVEPRGADDPDIYLVTTYKNWAALDGLADKLDASAKQAYGSVASSNQAAVDRSKIRRTLGSTTMQVLELK